MIAKSIISLNPNWRLSPLTCMQAWPHLCLLSEYLGGLSCREHRLQLNQQELALYLLYIKVTIRFKISKSFWSKSSAWFRLKQVFRVSDLNGKLTVFIPLLFYCNHRVLGLCSFCTWLSIDFLAVSLMSFPRPLHALLVFGVLYFLVILPFVAFIGTLPSASQWSSAFVLLRTRVCVWL